MGTPDTTDTRHSSGNDPDRYHSLSHCLTDTMKGICLFDIASMIYIYKLAYVWWSSFVPLLAINMTRWNSVLEKFIAFESVGVPSKYIKYFIFPGPQTSYR